MALTNIAPTTELEAVNAMLAAIGESPLSSQSEVDTPVTADVEMAVNTLRDALRDVLAESWRFNTEFGYEVVKAANFNWTDTDGVTTQLGIYKPPANLLAFEVSDSADQSGYKLVDTTLRPSRLYKEAGLAVPVFYDRVKNRDGFPTADRTRLFIDAVWYMDFAALPDVARRYITVVAARRFLAINGQKEIIGYTQLDEGRARKNLKQREGRVDSYSMFMAADVYAARGRIIYGAPLVDRTNAGPA